MQPPLSGKHCSGPDSKAVCHSPPTANLLPTRALSLLPPDMEVQYFPALALGWPWTHSDWRMHSGGTLPVPVSVLNRALLPGLSPSPGLPSEKPALLDKGVQPAPTHSGTPAELPTECCPTCDLSHLVRDQRMPSRAPQSGRHTSSCCVKSLSFGVVFTRPQTTETPTKH